MNRRLCYKERDLEPHRAEAGWSQRQRVERHSTARNANRAGIAKAQRTEVETLPGSPWEEHRPAHKLTWVSRLYNEKSVPFVFRRSACGSCSGDPRRHIAFSEKALVQSVSP